MDTKANCMLLNAEKKISPNIYGPQIVHTALQNIGVPIKEIANRRNGYPEYAGAVSVIFTKATNQDIIPGQQPRNVLSTSILRNSLLHDSRFEQVPIGEAAPGDIVVESGGNRAAGYAGIVVDRGQIVTMGASGVPQYDSHLMRTWYYKDGITLFRYLGVQKKRASTFTNANFNPDEPRIPAGQPGGGQWALAPSTTVLTGGNNWTYPSSGNPSPSPNAEWNASVPNENERSQQIQYAKLANAVYQDDGGVSAGLIPPGYNVVPFPAGSPTANDPSTGFFATLYRNNSTGAYILAFRGTDSKRAVADWSTDVRNAFGWKTAQYEEAIKLAQYAKGMAGGKLTLVGHSLGGGLAIASSLSTQTPAVTFNAATPNDWLLNANKASTANANQLITNFYVRGDIVSSLQHFSADGGNLIAMGPSAPDPVGIVPGRRIGLNPVDPKASPVQKHGMDDVLGSMQQ
jgi:hypothetical protein